MGYGQVRIKDNTPASGDFTNVATLLALAATWSTTINNSTYLGANAQLVKLGIFADGSNGTACYQPRNIQGHIKLPLTPYMLYL